MRLFRKIGWFDVRTINEEIEAKPHLWGQFGWRKNIPNGPHSGMTDIWVRYNAYENLGARFNDAHDSTWYPAYYELPALKDIIFQLMKETEGERLGGVLITKISPDSGINPHRDAGWHVDYYDKFYVSLKSAQGAVFCSEDEILNPNPGECWRFDNRFEHWVENKSIEDRVTLIICIKTEKYARATDSHALNRAAG